MSEKPVAGIHHVTAIAGDFRRCVEFYTGVLGLRLVKRTVNFDDPSAYHIYFGDKLGTPGTLMTFFVWPGAPRGRVGSRQVTGTGFSVPEGSLPSWSRHLEDRRIAHRAMEGRFGARLLALADPDGIALELVEDPLVPRRSDPAAGTTGDIAIGGVHHVTLSLRSFDPTVRMLESVLGFGGWAEEDGRMRARAAGDGAPGGARHVELVSAPDPSDGLTGAGIVHHVAWRAADDAQQRSLREAAAVAGLHPTPVIDRRYFRSVYFREPGGVLFEIATDGPGMTVDEEVKSLGSTLRLPPWFESRREEIEASLPPVGGPPPGI